MKPVRTIALWACALFVFASCTKSVTSKEINAEVTLKSVAGNPSACQWCLELPDGSRLDPVNDISKFNISLRDGKTVKVVYMIHDQEISPCLMGQSVLLTNVAD
jgi:hypothetical protein